MIIKEENNTSAVLTSDLTVLEKVQEESLRPQNFQDYIGQENNKRNLSIFIEAAKKRKESLEHLLIYGPPGLGKTTLAQIIAKEMNVNLKSTSGPALEKSGDLAAILSNLKENDVLFIDEIHRLKRIVEETLYGVMEDFGLDIVIGKGPTARIMRITIPKFTLIGATTKAAMLSSPLRDRFGAIIRVDFYTEQDIYKIVLRSAKILDFKISEEAAKKLAASARSTPRVANRLLRRTRDFATYFGKEMIDEEIVDKTLSSLGIDLKGLERLDRQFLKILANKFNGGPVGLNTISTALNEDSSTVEDVLEPYLIRLGLLERTLRGRKITGLGLKHIS